ncbi:hypothetical protein ACK30B_10830, partial [Aeromonas caviae]
SRSFWRYWVSAIGKFIPKSGAECRIKNNRILLDVKEGERNLLLVEFDEPYDGPIEVNANKLRCGEMME